MTILKNTTKVIFKVLIKKCKKLWHEPTDVFFKPKVLTKYTQTGP